MAQPKKYQICENCGREFPKNRTYFKRHTDKNTGKDCYKTICRECEEKLLIEDNWKDGKLKCHICGEWLSPDEFDSHSEYKYRNHKDKRCKKCKRELIKKAREKYSPEMCRNKILLDRWFAAKDRANKKNIPFTITKEDLIELWENQNGLCALSKIPMTCELDNGRVFTNVSVDQINPGKGYTKDNVQLICQAVNLLKSDWDMQTILYICKQIIDNN